MDQDLQAICDPIDDQQSNSRESPEQEPPKQLLSDDEIKERRAIIMKINRFKSSQRLRKYLDDFMKFDLEMMSLDELKKMLTDIDFTGCMSLNCPLTHTY